MAGKKSLTKTYQIEALKEYGIPTEKRDREITNEIVGDASDKILEGADQVFSGQSKKIYKRLGTLDTKIDSIKAN